MKALIIVDMLKDFVDGKLANPRAQGITEPLQRLLAHARENGWVVVFSNDAHQPGDPEMKIWGEHAMAGDPGAEVIDELAPSEGDIISEKQHYGAFELTGLDEQLRAPRRRRGRHHGPAHAHLRPALVLRRSHPRLRDHDPARRGLRVRGRERGRRARLPDGDLRRDHHDRRRAGRRARGRFGLELLRHGRRRSGSRRRPSPCVWLGWAA